MIKFLKIGAFICFMALGLQTSVLYGQSVIDSLETGFVPDPDPGDICNCACSGWRHFSSTTGLMSKNLYNTKTVL